MAIGLGCMRLSTDAARDAGRGRAVIAAAVEAGIALLDTSDAYALDDSEVGHNERLIAAALAELPGRRVEVVTKGGLIRPGGAWQADGRARHLADAARASRDRLGVAAIDLYLLHAVDPRVPLATSVRALARLRDDGVARRIGLSNVGLPQLEAALAITAIEAVEIELSPWKLDAMRGGLVAACAARGIRVLAHRPLGGPAGVRRAAADPVIAAHAARLDATPAELVLAWLASLSPVIVPLPGATQVATARSAARAASLRLDDDARAALDERFVVIGHAAPQIVAGREAPPVVVMVMGMPASGKSTIAERYAADGYVRLNRDERGGSLIALARELDRALAGGARRIVVDNTYPTRASRAPVLEVAQRHGAAVRCLAMATSLEDAQHNAVLRILARHGRLLMPGSRGDNELARAGEIDPRALFRFRREYEPPRSDEGFAAIEDIAFVRRAATGGAPALIVELDGIVWRGRPRRADAIELVPGAREALAAWSPRHRLAGTTWQPGLTDIAELTARLRELVGLEIDVVHCGHPPGPPVCWCRKPLPGLALALAHRHGFDLARTLHLGKGPADRGFAARAGIRYADIADGWPVPDADEAC
jgi:aryl-alcohol dehydrogenase-like predicted oxidoreductase/histidinol phosphatase-like enzyme